MITLKVTRNQGFTLFLEDTFLEKPQRRVGSNWFPSCLEHFWMTASNLQQLLALYFTNIYGWQLSSSEKSMVGKKLIHVSQGFHRFRFPFFIFSLFFSIFFNKCLFTLSVTRSVCCTLRSIYFFGLETPKHNDFDQFWKLKFHLEHFQRNTRILSFDGPSNYLYLFRNHRKTFSWPVKCPLSNLKVTKMWWSKY